MIPPGLLLETIPPRFQGLLRFHGLPRRMLITESSKVPCSHPNEDIMWRDCTQQYRSRVRIFLAILRAMKDQDNPDYRQSMGPRSDAGVDRSCKDGNSVGNQESNGSDESRQSWRQQ